MNYGRVLFIHIEPLLACLLYSPKLFLCFLWKSLGESFFVSTFALVNLNYKLKTS